MSQILPTGRFQTWKGGDDFGVVGSDRYGGIINAQLGYGWENWGDANSEYYYLPFLPYSPLLGSGEIADFTLLDSVGKNIKSLQCTYNISGPAGPMISGNETSQLSNSYPKVRIPHYNFGGSTNSFQFPTNSPGGGTGPYPGWSCYFSVFIGPDRGLIYNIRHEDKKGWVTFPWFSGYIEAKGIIPNPTNDPNFPSILWGAGVRFGPVRKTPEPEESEVIYVGNANWPIWWPTPAPEYTGEPGAFWSSPTHSGGVDVTFNGQTVPRQWLEGFVVVQGQSEEELIYGELEEWGPWYGRLNDDSKNWTYPNLMLSGSIDFETVESWEGVPWD